MIHILTDGLILNTIDSWLLIVMKYYMFPLLVNISAALLIFLAGIVIRNWKKRNDHEKDPKKDYDKLSVTRAVTMLMDKIL